MSPPRRLRSDLDPERVRETEKKAAIATEKRREELAEQHAREKAENEHRANLIDAGVIDE